MNFEETKKNSINRVLKTEKKTILEFLYEDYVNNNFTRELDGIKIKKGICELEITTYENSRMEIVILATLIVCNKYFIFNQHEKEDYKYKINLNKTSNHKLRSLNSKNLLIEGNELSQYTKELINDIYKHINYIDIYSFDLI